MLNIRVFPRDSIFIDDSGTGSSGRDNLYFKLKEINNTNVQVLLDKSIEDLVDRDVPQNVLKFKIECMSKLNDMVYRRFMSVNVFIEDVNDNAPEFENAPYQVYVEESTPIGTKIFTGISAFDRDKPDTPNSDVQYSIQIDSDDSGGPYFALESPHRPHVLLRRHLDFDEGNRMYEIPIIAKVS